MKNFKLLRVISLLCLCAELSAQSPFSSPSWVYKSVDADTNYQFKDSDAKAYFVALSNVGYDTLSSNLREAIDSFFIDLKGNGITTNNTNVYDSLHAVYLMRYDTLFSSINAVDTLNYTLDWNIDAVGTRDSINFGSGYCNTGFNPAASADINSFGVTFDIKENDFANNYGIIDTRDGVVHVKAILNPGFSSLIAYKSELFNSSSALQTVSYATHIAFVSFNRSGSTSHNIYRNGILAASNSTGPGLAMPDYNLYINVRNNAGSVGGGVGQLKLGFASIHRGLTANQMQDFYDAYNKLNKKLRGE